MPVKTVRPVEVEGYLKQGGRLIDVRTPAEYAQVHAVGATLVPLDRLDPQAELFATGATAASPLLVICKSGARAAKACEKFAAAGVEHVLSVEGGTDAWERAGLPVERTAGRVISLERQVRIVAGLFVVLGVALGWGLHPLWYALAAFVGIGLTVAGISDWCGLAMLLSRMPWNQSAATACRTPGGGPTGEAA